MDERLNAILRGTGLGALAALLAGTGLTFVMRSMARSGLGARVTSDADYWASMTNSLLMFTILGAVIGFLASLFTEVSTSKKKEQAKVDEDADVEATVRKAMDRDKPQPPPG